MACPARALARTRSLLQSHLLIWNLTKMKFMKLCIFTFFAQDVKKTRNGEIVSVNTNVSYPKFQSISIKFGTWESGLEIVG
jgi:hypothetical protein